MVAAGCAPNSPGSLQGMRPLGARGERVGPRSPNKKIFGATLPNPEGDNGDRQAVGEGPRSSPRPPAPRTQPRPLPGSYSRLRIFPSRSLLGRPRCISSRAERGPMARRRGPRRPSRQPRRLASPCVSWSPVLASAVTEPRRWRRASPWALTTGRKRNPGLVPPPRADYNSQRPPRLRLRTGHPNGAMAAAAAETPEVLRECGCKGIRTCLICERQRGGDPPWELPPAVRDRGLVHRRRSASGETEAQLGHDTGRDQSL